MNVDYDKQTVNAKNFFARYAHRSRLKISVNIILHSGYWLDVGRPSDYQQAQNDIKYIKKIIL